MNLGVLLGKLHRWPASGPPTDAHRQFAAGCPSPGTASRTAKPAHQSSTEKNGQTAPSRTQATTPKTAIAHHATVGRSPNRTLAVQREEGKDRAHP